MQPIEITAQNSKRRKRARHIRAEKRYRYLSIAALCMAVVLLALYLSTVLIQRRDDSQREGLRGLYYNQTARRTGSFFFADAKADEWTADVPERFVQLFAINPDLMGWITAGDAVDEPVVYRDNEFYLDHSFYQEYSAGGTVFADVENAAWDTDGYVILYGHNMRNGSMFGELEKYRKLEYLKENAAVTLDTVTGEAAKSYVPFAVFDASMMLDDPNYFHLRRFEEYQTGDEARIQAFLDELRQRSLFDVPVDVMVQDRVLALVTCSYGDPDGRMMLFCRELREGETVEDMQALMQQCAEK